MWRSKIFEWNSRFDEKRVLPSYDIPKGFIIVLGFVMEEKKQIMWTVKKHQPSVL